MGVRPGIVWAGGNTPSNLGARVSVLAQAISDEEMIYLINELLEEATAEVEESIRTRGVKNGTTNNDGRIKSGKMLKSVTFRTFITAEGRIGGEFGYLLNPPEWALWQEYGTYGGQGNGQGILAMLALTDAFAKFKVKLENRMAKVGTKGVRNNRGGFYDFRENPPVRGY